MSFNTHQGWHCLLVHALVATMVSWKVTYVYWMLACNKYLAMTMIVRTDKTRGALIVTQPQPSWEIRWQRNLFPSTDYLKAALGHFQAEGEIACQSTTCLTGGLWEITVLRVLINQSICDWYAGGVNVSDCPPPVIWCHLYYSTDLTASATASHQTVSENISWLSFDFVAEQTKMEWDNNNSKCYLQKVTLWSPPPTIQKFKRLPCICW